VTIDKISRQVEAPIRQLNKLVEHTPELADAAAFYREALPLLLQHRRTVASLQMSRSAVQRKLGSGLALLVGEELPIDTQTTRKLFLRLCKIIENEPVKDHSNNGHRSRWNIYRPVDAFSLLKSAQNGDGQSLRAAAARHIRQSVERNELDLVSILGMLASGDLGSLEITAIGKKLDIELLRALAWYSLQPAFQVWAQELSSTADFDSWRHGYCPVCGSRPSFSETQGKEAARRLRCGLCGSSWSYPHLQCAFCGNKNYKLLCYFNVDGEGDRFRVQACNVCRGYIKSIKTFDPISVDLLPVLDLETIHLDFIAAEREYTRMTVR